MIEGKVDNGATGFAVIEGAGSFSGRVGIRERGEGIEIAYVGTPPRKFPVEVNVDGRKYRAVEKAEGAAPGFAVLNLVKVDS